MATDFSRADRLLKDRTGRPLRFLHGTTASFDQFGRFDCNAIVKRPVYFFTTSAEYANRYTVGSHGRTEGGRIIMVHLTAPRIFDLRRPGHRAYLEEAFEKDGYSPAERRQYLKDYFIKRLPHWENHDTIKLAQDNGFDGIRMIERKGIESIAVFSTEHIASWYECPAEMMSAAPVFVPDPPEILFSEEHSPDLSDYLTGETGVPAAGENHLTASF